MGFQEVINIILPPRSDNNGYYRPAVTHSASGKRQDYYAARPGRIHLGVDFNYHYSLGNALGQSGINLAHPKVYSPVSGHVNDTDPRFGMIEIKDVQKYRHQIWHLNSFSVDIGTPVYAGQHIGDMGGMGPHPKSDGRDQYDQHVHYSVVTQPDPNVSKDSGDFIDPEHFWNNNLYYTINAGKLNHLPLEPASLLDPATQELLNSSWPGLNILSNGETLKREGNQIWRIKPNSSTRGYFISE